MYYTRFAPSPTGDLHLGSCRTAYFNWLAARASGGSFLLRIDDTDRERSKEQYTQSILSTMQWLAMDYDNLIYQSDWLENYFRAAEHLVEIGKAKQLDDGAIVLKIPDNPRKFWHDELAGDIAITQDDLDKMADGIPLTRQDGTATFHWACVYDDTRFGINYIIRGVDHITNTARHVMIYDAINMPLPKYVHIGLIHLDGKKLSKRDGAASVMTYQEKGYDPDALLNFLARLGWSPTQDDKSTAVLPREKMLEMFLTAGRMKASSANMDLKKLDSFDRKYKARKKC